MVVGKDKRPKLRGVGYLEARRAFERAGWSVDRQKGSHIVMTKPGALFIVCLPAHRPVAEGTLRQCIRAAGLTEAEFVALLR